MSDPPPKWEEVVELKKNMQKSALAAHLKPRLDPLSQEICALEDLGDLCERLLDRNVTAESVMRAYASQAAIAHERVCSGGTAMAFEPRVDTDIRPTA